MTKKMAMNKINEAELNRVAGGTVGEFEELLSAFATNSAMKGYFKAVAHIPGVNIAEAKIIESWMSENMHIDADISLGLGGTGLLSKHNSYRDTRTGQYLSQSEVLDRIKKYGA